MAGRDDPYDRGEPEEDTSRPGRRHATRPARPAWDALTYGRPDDARAPRRGRPSEEPSYGPSSQEPEPDWTSMYGAAPTAPSAPSYAPPTAPAAPSYDPPPAPTAPSYGPPPTAPSYGPPPASTAPSYAPPYSSSPNPASSYPAATDSYAPESYTSYRAAPAPDLAGDQPEPVYVPAGLYLDEPESADPAIGGLAPGDRTGVRPQGDASAYPGGTDDEPAPSKGGRNVPAAIGVGVGLGALVLGTLFLWRPAFLGVVAAAVCIGIWEMVRALRLTGANPPLIPLVGGGALMTGLAWWGGTEGLTFGLVITVVAVMVWRFAHGAEGYAADVSMAALVAVYVPFLGGFAAMLASAPDGQLRVLATLVAVVLSDTGGYVVGSRLGRHPMAPSVSPKKSWEGLGGSLLAAALGSGLVLWLMFGVTFWAGLLFGLAIAVASVVGDLGESMVKRALGVKDMSGLLPGHGGVMDRLDSVLFAAPVGFVLLSILVPVM
jgi:phosphatidate cytidylyltransferase